MISFADARRVVLSVDQITETEELPLHLVLDRAAAAGTPVAAGVTLRPAHLALLAAQGANHPAVHAPAIVGLVVVRQQAPDEDDENAVADPTTAMLAASAQQAGAIPLDMGIAPPNHELQGAAIIRALETAHVVCLAGLGSDQEYAKLQESIRALEGEVVFDAVAQEPGGRLLFARFEDGWAFAMPDDPPAALACFHLYIRPLVRTLAGHAAVDWPSLVVDLPAGITPTAATTRLDWVKAAWRKNGEPELTPVGAHLVEANGLLITPPDAATAGATLFLVEP